MNDFERRDEQFDDQVQIEHLDLSDPTGCVYDFPTSWLSPTFDDQILQS